MCKAVAGSERGSWGRNRMASGVWEQRRQQCFLAVGAQCCCPCGSLYSTLQFQDKRNWQHKISIVCLARKIWLLGAIILKLGLQAARMCLLLPPTRWCPFFFKPSNYIFHPQTNPLGKMFQPTLLVKVVVENNNLVFGKTQFSLPSHC